MAARMAVEEQQQAAAPAAYPEAEEVSVDAIGLLIPGLIERVKV
ncbi:hypothetical protein [Streptomyces liliifuscus]|nr:hypothetical protein [Streptomyces liliifuscus]